MPDNAPTEPTGRPIILLGPQRQQPGVGKAVADLGILGPLAVVTAGWEERELEDEELIRELERSQNQGGSHQTINLSLFPRADEVFTHHPALRELMAERENRRKMLRELYNLRLAPQLVACRELLNRVDLDAHDRPDDPLYDPEIDDAIEGVRRLDDHHLARVSELEAEMAERFAGDHVDHPVLLHHRRQVAELVAASGALLIAGGHVGTLMSVLRLFDVMNLAADKPVVAWSAGAMAIGERVVLFHDSPARGAGDAEVFGPGFGLVPGIIPLPHARHRIALDDRRRVALMARRFAPSVCVGLDYTARIDSTAATGGVSLDTETGSDAGNVLGAGWQATGEVTVLQPGGGVMTTGAIEATRPPIPPPVPATVVATDSTALVASLANAARSGPDALTRALEQRSFPVVGDGWALFVYRGQADDVRLHHWVSGLPSSQPFTRVPGTDLWTYVGPLQRRARVEYKFEVRRGGHHELIRDPFNSYEARDPFGANSVVRGPDYQSPDWAQGQPSTRRGTVVNHHLHSSVFGGPRAYSVYLPARFRPERRYPLVIVHDGIDYLRYASLVNVLDNLIHRLEIPPLIAALTQSPDRLNEYGANPDHGRFLTEDLVPDLESRYRLADVDDRVLLGASFGAVASLHAAWSHPGAFNKLLLQSGSFAFTDVGSHDLGPVFDPVVEFMNQFRAEPGRPADQIFVSAGVYESLIYFNRSLLPVLQDTGARVRMVEAPDGHNWENWRDHLREGLTWLLPGPQWLIYE